MLSSRQRAKLRMIAHDLEPILHIGKGGISENTVMQAEEALVARELIKGTCLEISPISAQDAMTVLSEKTGAEGVLCIGRRFVLYRKNPKDPKIVF